MAAKKSLRECHPDRTEVPFLLALALCVLIAGLSLPILTVEKTLFWRHWENHYSVFVGVVELTKHGDWALAIIVFFFSMVFPFAKLLSLTVIWYQPLSEKQRMLALHWLGILGKWSMLDVFAVAILVVAAKLRTLTQVQPRIGVYLFGLAIFLSMMATMVVERLAKKAKGSRASASPATAAPAGT